MKYAVPVAIFVFSSNPSYQIKDTVGQAEIWKQLLTCAYIFND